MRLLLVSTLLTGTMLWMSCGDKPKDESGTFENIDFDAWVDNYQTVTHQKFDAIIPAYQQFLNSVDSSNSPMDTNFVAGLRAYLLSLYEAYQGVEVLEFDDPQRVILNTFPVDSAALEQFVLDGNYNMEAVDHVSTQGLPALEYMLFYTDIETITDRLNNENNYLQYFKAVLNRVVQTGTVKPSPAGWNGNYSSSNVFSSSGPVALVVNNMVFTYELSTRARVGIPLGKFSAAIPLPEKVEGKYIKKSHVFLQKNLHAIHQMYLGYESEGSGLGLEELVLEVDNGQELDAEIQSQFAIVLNLVDNLNTPLDELIENNPSMVDNLYAELKKLVVLLKVDLPSRLGVLITYQDNDGD